MPLSCDHEEIPLIDLFAANSEVQGSIFGDLQKLVIDSNFIGGRWVTDFEGRFADFAEARHVVGVSNGTDALALALRASDIGVGCDVITSGHTFVATVEAIIATGATPVLADVDPRSGLMDLDSLPALVTPKTRAIIPVHLYGTPVDLGRLDDFCRQHDLALIQDAAQAHGARWEGQPLAAYGHAQTYSFFPGKNLGAWGDAGAVATMDASVAERIRALRNHGRLPGQKYEHALLGGNCRIDALQSLVLYHKAERLAAKNIRRRELAEVYRRDLRDIGDLTPMDIDCRATPAYHLFVVRTAHREAVRRHLTDAGIATGIHYPIPVHRQPAFTGVAMRWLDLTHVDRLADEVVSLPFYPEMTTQQIARVCESLRSYFQSHAHGRV